MPAPREWIEVRASGTGASVALIRVKLRLTWQSGPLASRSSPGMTNGRYAPSPSARRSLQFRSSVRTSSCDPCANLLTSVWSTRKARLSPERLLHTLPDHEGLPDDALSHFAAGADPQAEPPAHIGLVVEFDAVAGEGGRACTSSLGPGRSNVRIRVREDLVRPGTTAETSKMRFAVRLPSSSSRREW